MPLPSAAVANYFLDLGLRESIPITPLKLQKLVYFAHGWYLGFTGEPLLNEGIQAWEYGPVIPSLYHDFKEFGNNPITRYAGGSCHGQKLSQELLAARSLIERVWAVYSKFTASQLSALSHEANGPWQQVVARMERGPFQKNAQIPNDLISRFFRSRAGKVVGD